MTIGYQTKVLKGVELGKLETFSTGTRRVFLLLIACE